MKFHHVNYALHFLKKQKTKQKVFNIASQETTSDHFFYFSMQTVLKISSFNLM
jgi:hypothetical protein